MYQRLLQRDFYLPLQIQDMLHKGLQLRLTRDIQLRTGTRMQCTHARAPTARQHITTYTTHGWQTEETQVLNITDCARWRHMTAILPGNNAASCLIVTSAGLSETKKKAQHSHKSDLLSSLHNFLLNCCDEADERYFGTLCLRSQIDQETGPHFLYACQSWTIETQENFGWSDDSRFLMKIWMLGANYWG